MSALCECSLLLIVLLSLPDGERPESVFICGPFWNSSSVTSSASVSSQSTASNSNCPALFGLTCARNAPDAARKWVDVVTSWDFQRVLPAHFETNLAVKPAELRRAFSFLDEGKNSVRFCDEDVAFLRDALDSLPPDLALYDTPLGPLRGKACGLEKGTLDVPLRKRLQSKKS